MSGALWVWCTTTTDTNCLRPAAASSVADNRILHSLLACLPACLPSAPPSSNTPAQSPAAYATPESAVCVRLLVKLMSDYLNELTYPAELAGLGYSISNHLAGFQVGVHPCFLGTGGGGGSAVVCCLKHWHGWCGPHACSVAGCRV
jgi:hypothetical protein